MKTSVVFIACAALAACATSANPAGQQHFTAYGEPCTAEEAARTTYADRRTMLRYEQKTARTCFTAAERRLAGITKKEDDRYRDRWRNNLATAPDGVYIPPPPGIR
jgi:hypothetical protein